MRLAGSLLAGTVHAERVEHLVTPCKNLFGAVFFGCGVYIAVMLLTGGLREDDLERIPMIGRFGIKFLRRIGVFKSEAE